MALSLDAEAPVGELRQTSGPTPRRARPSRPGCSRTSSDGRAGLRSHVSCFADLVYPIQALVRYHSLPGDRPALAGGAPGAPS